MNAETVATLADTIRPSALIVEAVRTPRGHLRIETAFRYPDGSSIDLYVPGHGDLLSPVEVPVLTDFGTTFTWLSHLGIDPRRNRRRRALLDDILSLHDVGLHGSALRAHVRERDAQAAVVRLGQACVRVSDLAFTHRIASPASRFGMEVEDRLAELDLDYDLDAEVRTPSGNIARVDFVVRGHAQAAIMTLPSDIKLPAQARTKAEHVFAVLTDLRSWPGIRLAALDDRAPAYAEQDLSRIREIVPVIPLFGDPEAFAQALGVARGPS